MVSDIQIVDGYEDQKLSEMQLAKLFSISPNRVRRILDQHQVQRRSISDAITNLNITKFNKRPFVAKTELNANEQMLKWAGVMLYWGEGTKKGASVALSNSDPLMVLVFVAFLRSICGVDEKRMRIGLHYYQDHNPDTLVAYWSKLTGVPKSQFDRPFLHNAGKGSYKLKSKYGTVAVRYSDTKLLTLIINWIVDAQRQLLE